MAKSIAISAQLTTSDLKVPVALVILSMVPTIAGIVRLLSLGGHAPVSTDDARFLQAPAPVLVHILSVTPFCIVGAFQFSRAMRARWPRLHRRAGRVVALSGLLAGATGLWMTLRYEIPTSLQGPLLYPVRIAVAAAMMAAIIIAWRSILRRNVARHEAFMIRAYALGQGAGTQVLILGPWTVMTGNSGGLTRDVLMTLAWAINVAVAEAIIRRPSLRCPGLRRSDLRHDHRSRERSANDTLAVDGEACGRRCATGKSFASFSSGRGSPFSLPTDPRVPYADCAVPYTQAYRS